MFLESAIRSGMTAVAKSAAIPFYRAKLRRFERMLGRAPEVQHATLFDKIRRCAESRFGRDHYFSQIRTVADFRRHVPITEYEYLAPYINEVAEGRIEALFPPTEKVYAFACTTGTTGQPKLNPVCKTWLREYRRGWEIWGIKSIVEHSEMIGTRMLQMTGPANLGRTPSGLSIGMVSAIAVRFQNRVMRWFYAVPFEVSDIGEPTAKYYSILRLALVNPVGFLVGINPASLLRLAEEGHEHRESLIRDIRNGTLRDDFDLPPEFRQQVAAQVCVKQPARARELERIIERTGTLYPKDYWPLSLIACWIGGTIGYQSRELPKYYGSTPARDLGLVSTEGRHTVPLHDNVPEGVLAVDGNYYEFIPVGEKASPNPTILEGHELEPGREYFILMTTASGLYRYDIDDVVRCQGFVGRAPVLEFLHKGSQCADMLGEKISAHQVASAVDKATRELGLSVDCFTAVPVRRDGELPYYALLVERNAIEDSGTARRFLDIVDRDLVKQNVMYAGKRSDRFIAAPRLVRLAPGTWSEFADDVAQTRGTGDSQYKHPSLVPDPAWIDRFQPVDTVSVDAACGS